MSELLPWIQEVAPDAVLALETIADCKEDLMMAERPLAHCATPARLRELRAGRSAARRAIQHLRIEPGPILAGETGEAIWPLGLCGSISHSSRYVAVLVALSSRYNAVGVDVVDERPLGPQVAAVASADELALFQQTFPLECSAADRFVFSAKEAIFKCQFPVTGNRALDFLDVRLRKGEKQAFYAEPVDAKCLSLAEVLGRMHVKVDIFQSIMIAYALLPREANPA